MAYERVAIVTGANRGIGAQIAAQLGERGLRVIGTSRETREGFVTLDVTRQGEIDALAARVANEGGVDVLVNNAGASFDGFDATVARRTLDANFFGAMHVTDAIVPAMRAGGRIVMVSSGMGELSHVRGAVRAEIEDPALSRSALIALMQSFVVDVASGEHTRRGWPSNAYSVSKVG
jgi:NAD(P)-dependent dehydrogenase (short-subunit alcohol dehydrogenase family)